MKRKILSIALILLGIFAFAQERTAIAVFPFEDMDNLFTKNESLLFYRRFSNEFVNKNNGLFRVIPRQDVEKLINTEAKFQLSDFSAQAKTAEMQRVLNGSQILSGYIGKMGNKISISISLFTYPDLEQLPGGVDIDVASKDELSSKIPDLVQSMMNAITKSGNTQNQIKIPANFVRVEGGTFQMGSPSGVYDNERPVHTVTVSSFYISKYEVNRKEWQEVMKRRGVPGGDNLPVSVSWYEAIEYCNERSKKEGLSPCYRGAGDNITCDWSANGYRLPTEAEWEYAAKGGNKDLLIYIYSGNNNAASVAWYIDNSSKAIKPVGTKSPNSLGIFDMSGNVSEWCWDLYDNYTNTVKYNPHGPDALKIDERGFAINYRISRGGSCSDSLRGITTTRRDYWNPWANSHTGIRLVRTISASGQEK